MAISYENMTLEELEREAYLKENKLALEVYEIMYDMIEDAYNEGYDKAVEEIDYEKGEE